MELDETYMFEVALIVAPESMTWHVVCVDKSLTLLVVVEFVLRLVHELVSSTVYHFLSLSLTI